MYRILNLLVIKSINSRSVCLSPSTAEYCNDESRMICVTSLLAEDYKPRPVYHGRTEAVQSMVSDLRVFRTQEHILRQHNAKVSTIGYTFNCVDCANSVKLTGQNVATRLVSTVISPDYYGAIQYLQF
jgi:hypothetical protein